MMKRLLICTLVLGITIPILAADDDATTITDPSKTGAEYAIQGEYLGKIEAEQGMETWSRTGHCHGSQQVPHCRASRRSSG